MILRISLLAVGVGALALLVSWWFKRRRHAVLQKTAGNTVDRADPAGLLENALALFATGSTDTEALRILAQSNREGFTETLLSFTKSVSGESRDRLCELALKLLLVEQWCETARGKDSTVRRKCYSRLEIVAHYEPVHRVAREVLLRGLQDSEPQIRFLAARALAHGGDPNSIAQVLEVAVAETAENRLILAQDLLPFALSICGTAIPRALGSSRAETVLGVLEMLEAWECALILEDVSDLARHSNNVVRQKIMLMLPKMPHTWQNRNAILTGLADPNVQVRMAAAQTAGRMRITAAIPALSLCLRHGDKDLERAAADALREMQAADVLEEFFGPKPQESVLPTARNA